MLNADACLCTYLDSESVFFDPNDTPNAVNVPSLQPASGCLTSVQDEETASHSPTITPIVQAATCPFPDVTFRHSGWQPTRTRVFEAMKAAELSQNRIRSFCECGSRAWVWQAAGEPDKFRTTSSRCHDRWCLPCAIERSRIIANSLQQAMDGHTCRFLTLTVRSADQPLKDLLDKLYQGFAALRRRKFWVDGVHGGAAFCELTLGRDGQTWHPHLHIIMTGRYIPQAIIRDAWKEITTDSYIVDIRPIRDQATASRYVAKYASKPLCQTLAKNHDRLVEAILALKGRRLCMTFGDWRSVKLTEPPEDELTSDVTWVSIGPLNSIIADAATGNVDSIHILEILEGKTKCKKPTKPT